MKTNLVAIYHHPGMQTLHTVCAQQDHRTLILWALETGKEILDIFAQVFPEDNRPSEALDAAEAWSRGEIKMPLAKKAARETHQAAKDAKMAKGNLNLDVAQGEDSQDCSAQIGGLQIDAARIDAAIAAAHAMGQIIGVVHVATHSTAYAAYAVQAKVILNSERDPEEALAEAVDYLSERLKHWASAGKCNRPWATFL